MSEMLSQDEIDQLLTAINIGTSYAGIEEFEASLLKRRLQPEEPYGHSFNKEVAVCRFTGIEREENLLADIERKNQKQGMGNVTIPHTKIKLVNYSVCPKCNTVFSFKDLMCYYKNPKPDPTFSSPVQQIRGDTRVCCTECGMYFFPTLIISDGTPRNQTQFLCRAQTINAIEDFFKEQGKLVLTQKPQNMIRKNKKEAFRNDVLLEQLESKPTLITNLLQYTPPPLMLNLIDGSNIEKGDVLYGAWRRIAKG